MKSSMNEKKWDKATTYYETVVWKKIWVDEYIYIYEVKKYQKVF